jgi:hypothetical protein
MTDLIWIKFLCSIWSFTINLSFWIVNILSLKQTFRDRLKLKESITNIADIKNAMLTFEWKQDKWKDWQPWIITLIKRNYQDDCDGAAVLGKFLFKQLGTEGRIYSLRGKKTGHAIFVSDDLSSLVTNNEVSTGDPGKWTDSRIKLHFNLKYNRIIK